MPWALANAGDIPKAKSTDLTNLERTFKRTPLRKSRFKGEIWQEYNTLSMFRPLLRPGFPALLGVVTQVTDLQKTWPTGKVPDGDRNRQLFRAGKSPGVAATQQL
jgi:hypothetical protein